MNRLSVHSSVRNQLDISDHVVFKSDFDYFELINAINTMTSIKNNVKGKENFILSNESLSGDSLLGSIDQYIRELNTKLECRIASTRESIRDELSIAEVIAIKGKIPRLQRIFDRFNATEQEQKVVTFLFNPVQASYFDSPNDRYYSYRDSNETMKIFELSQVLNLDVSVVIQVLTNSKFADEKFFKLKDSSQDPYGYGYDEEDQAPPGTNDAKFITPLHNVGIKKVIKQILMGANPNSSAFIALSSKTLQEILKEERLFDGKESPLGITGLYNGPTAISDAAQLLARQNGDNYDDILHLLREDETTHASRKNESVAADLASTQESVSMTITEQLDGEYASKPYTTDLEFMQDYFNLCDAYRQVCSVTFAYNMHNSKDTDGIEDVEEVTYSRRGRVISKDKQQQTLDYKAKMIKANEKHKNILTRINTRMEATNLTSKWVPRFLRLINILQLDHFEIMVICKLMRSVILLPDAKEMEQNYLNGTNESRQQGRSGVQQLLQCFSRDLSELISNRKYFNKSSTIIKEGIVMVLDAEDIIRSGFNTSIVEIDRRVLDFLIGLDTELSEIVDGSHLYNPTTDIDDVIISPEIKENILNIVSNYEVYKKAINILEIDKKLSYGLGITLLFSGESGTGKTALANAIGKLLKKKILLVNFPNLGVNSPGYYVKMIFREAKIHNSLVFFDECESLFLSRDKDHASRVNTLLTELEHYDGICILATNRPKDLDEAMHRRIQYSFDFKKPDYLYREQIWKKLKPEKVTVSADVDYNELAIKYEISGGFIKNCWLSAVSHAIGRHKLDKNMLQKEGLTISQEDLKMAAATQVKSRMASCDFERKVIPKFGIDGVIAEEGIKNGLQDIVNWFKAQTVLVGQWGFAKTHDLQGCPVLLSGISGGGKSLSAQAIAFELGKPLKVVNCSNLLSKWVGESSKNIEAVFADATNNDAVLVFDEAEALFGTRAGSGDASRHDTMNVGLLLHHMEAFNGVVIVITNMKQAIDEAFFRRFRYALDYTMPSVALRKKLWRALVPAECPVHSDVDYDILANNYEFCGGFIKNIIFKVASRVALRSDNRVLTMNDFLLGCEEERAKKGDASAKYNAMYA